LSRDPAGNGLNPLRYLAAEPTRVKVVGKSMVPFLEEGDDVEIVAAEIKDFSAGDIIVFSRGGELIVHRVIKIRGCSFLEIGDNQWNGSWQEWQEYTGKVLAVVKMDGTRILLDDEAEVKNGKRTAKFQALRHYRSIFERKARFHGLKRIVGLPFRFLEFMMTRKCLL